MRGLFKGTIYIVNVRAAIISLNFIEVCYIVEIVDVTKVFNLRASLHRYHCNVMDHRHHKVNFLSIFKHTQQKICNEQPQLCFQTKFNNKGLCVQNELICHTRNSDLGKSGSPAGPLFVLPNVDLSQKMFAPPECFRRDYHFRQHLIFSPGDS